LYQEAATVPGLRMVGQEAPPELVTQPRTPNPRITVNDRTQNFSELYSPAYMEDTNFETISLRDESPGENDRGSVDPEQSPCNFSRPREGHNVTPTQRPSVIVTDGSLPQLQLQFALPQSRSHQTVSSIYDDDEGVDVNSPNERDAMNDRSHFQNHGNDEGKTLEEHGQEVGGTIPKENVKDMIQEWERVNGRFGREC
jgi:hypothetical protein